MDRLAKSNDESVDYNLPELCEYSGLLISLLSDIGEAKADSNGLRELEWVDLKAWKDVSGIYATSSELESIKNLSSIYVSQYYKSLEKGYVSPNIERPKDRSVVAGKMKSLIAMLRGS